MTHKRTFGDGRARNSSFAESAKASGTWPSVFPAKTEVRDRTLRNSEKVCNFCHKKGHWKTDCYALKAKNKRVGQAKGACLAVSVPKVLGADLERGEMQQKGFIW